MERRKQSLGRSSVEKKVDRGRESREGRREREPGGIWVGVCQVMMVVGSGTCGCLEEAVEAAGGGFEGRQLFFKFSGTGFLAQKMRKDPVRTASLF